MPAPIVTPDTLARAAAGGINAKASLADNDGHGFFEAARRPVVTGPTLTNVNDFRAILITLKGRPFGRLIHAPPTPRENRRHRRAGQRRTGDAPGRCSWPVPTCSG